MVFPRILRFYVLSHSATPNESRIWNCYYQQTRFVSPLVKENLVKHQKVSKYYEIPPKCLFEKGHPLQEKIKLILLNLTFYFNFDPLSFGIKTSIYGFLVTFFQNILFINEREF